MEDAEGVAEKVIESEERLSPYHGIPLWRYDSVHSQSEASSILLIFGLAERTFIGGTAIARTC